MDLFEHAEPGDNTPEFTVSEVAGTVRKLLEGEMGWVRVKGEVGRVVRARSGHMYFDLKDDKSVLSCMTWKGQIPGLSILPEEGMEVVVEGKMTASGMQSKFGLNAQRVSVAGAGALMAMLETRKKALEAEGLFAPERKKALPYLPEIIGVITSPQGAVIRDILHRLRDRFPRKVLVWPVAVQGKPCAPDVANAIEGFNRLTPGGALPRPDLIIVARGGGSIEDLWGFNEEIVARAAFASEIPLISAVGHETDTTLIDYVSDLRAPTPTAAAEAAVPVRVDLDAWVDAQDVRLARAVRRGIEQRSTRARDLARLLPRAEALLADPRQRLDRGEDALSRGLKLMIERKTANLARLSAGLRPAVLKGRLTSEEARVMRSADRLRPMLEQMLVRKSETLSKLRLRAAPIKDRLNRQTRDLDRLTNRIDQLMSTRMDTAAERLRALDRMRTSLGYKATLERGYAVVRVGDAVVTTAKAAAKARDLEIEFSDGRMKPAKP
ncbi:MAG: exodeoxyribonuclease VII large subunit [Lentilitoribacter sp.]